MTLLRRRVGGWKGYRIPTGSLDIWRSARALHASSLVEVVYFGDSTGFGSGASGGGLVRKIRDQAIAAGYTDGGRGVAAISETAATSGESLVPYVGVTGVWSNADSYDFLITDMKKSTAAGATITYQGKGTAVRIHNSQIATSARWSYSIDGGADVMVDGWTDYTLRIQTVLVTGLAEGTHTVVIKSYGNTYVPAPALTSVSQSGTGGASLALGSYDYVVTGVMADATETLPSAARTGTIAVAGRQMFLNIDPRTINGYYYPSMAISSLNIYRRPTGSGAYGLVGNVAVVTGNAFTTYSDTGAAAGVAPPNACTAIAGSGFRVAPTPEFLRAAGLVFHKQAVSGISYGGYFDPTKSASLSFPNGAAQAALGLSQGLGVNGYDYGVLPATKPPARNVKLAFSALGINDQQGATSGTLAAALNNVRIASTLFAQMATAAGASKVIVLPHFKRAANAQWAPQFRDVLLQVAVDQGCAVIDLDYALDVAYGSSWVGAGAPHLDQAASDVEGQFVFDRIAS